MAPVFSKNAILVGTVDNFCLVCETHLKSDEDTSIHITKPVHKKGLATTPYVPQFESEMIRKVKKGYFCELCNIFQNTMPRMKLHLDDPSHFENKRKTVFNRVGNFIVFDNIAISDMAWNGLNDNTCAVCNLEFDDVNMHKSQITHTLNLVQAKELFDKDKNLYRKFDDTAIHCLTCNVIISTDIMNTHFNDADHKKLYQACCDEKQKVEHDSKTKITTGESNKSNDNAKISSEKNQTFNKNGETSKFGSTSSKTCNDNKKPDVSEPETKKAKITSENESKEFQKIARENDFVLKKDKSLAYCRKCDIDISSLQLMKEHVSSKAHKENKEVARYKVPFNEFTNTMLILFHRDVIINDNICISFFSLLLLTPVKDDLYKCECCEKNIRFDGLVPYNSRLHNHDEQLNNYTYIIPEDGSEFIREVRPGSYHCGFCNRVISTWKNLKLHILTEVHNEKKNLAKLRLEQYRPVIAQDRRDRATFTRKVTNMYG